MTKIYDDSAESVSDKIKKIYGSGESVRIQKQMGLGDVILKNPVSVFQHHVSRYDQYVMSVAQGMLVNGGYEECSYEEYSIDQIKDGIMDNFCQKAAVIAKVLMKAADKESRE